MHEQVLMLQMEIRKESYVAIELLYITQVISWQFRQG